MILVGCDGAATDAPSGGAGGATAATDATGATGGPGSNTAGTGSSGGGEEIPAEEDPFDPPPAPPTLDQAALDDIADEIDAALGSVSGATHSALVVGLDSGQVVYERTPDTVRTPASNTKIFTTAASLIELGEAHRSTVRVFGQLAGGTVSGDLSLVAEHDPSSSTWFGVRSAQALDAVAGALAAKGITSIGGDVVAKGEFVYEGNSVGTIDYAAERGEVASAFRGALVARGISVGGTARGATGFDPPGGTGEIMTVPSVSLDVLSHAINVPSHNEFADLAMHHLGFVESGDDTYAAGESVVIKVLEDAGIDPAGLALNDGSGLSHQNRVTPRQIVELTETMLARPEGTAFLHSLSVSGVRGTIGGRLTGGDTNGRFWGKTGTLTGVIALSGILFHEHDGQRYIAAFLSNGVGNASAGRAGLDAAVAAVAKDRRGLAAPPGVVDIVSVTDDANGKTALVTWEEVAGAAGYLVWRSRDGFTFDRADARAVTATQHRTLGFDDTQRLFVRVTAIGAGGESLPSTVLGASLSDDGARILLVDGNDRSRLQPIGENPLGWGHQAIARHASSIAGAFESCANEAVEDGSVDLTRYDLVVYALGRESVENESLSTGEQAMLAAYVEGGGSLLVSGSELAYDLVSEGSPDDVGFARDVLGIGYGGDDAATTLVTPSVAGYDAPLARFGWLGQDEVPFPDLLTAEGGATVCATYAAGEAGAACVSRSTAAGGKVVVLGVPLEAFDDPLLRKALLDLAASP